MYPGAYVSEFPDKPAVVVAETGEILTYADLDDRSLRLARYFYDAGLRSGDHIALLAENGPRVFEIAWAALRSGLYFTAVNRHLSPSEISYIINDCGARALIVSARLGEAARTVIEDTPRVRMRLSFGGTVPGHASYEMTLANTSPNALPSQPIGSDMLYSSGTTGRPKGIKRPLPAAQVDDYESPATILFRALHGLGPDTVYLSPAPIYHAAPLRFATMVQSLGGTVVLMEQFDAEGALAAIERHRVTHGQWVPTMFVRMLKLDEQIRLKYDLSSLRIAVHAAAPCPVDVKRAMIDWWGPILDEYYAATEGNGMTYINCEQWLQKPGSVGLPVLGTIHICDDQGVEVAAGTVGTVYFERNEQPEYHNDPEKTASALHPVNPLWMTTGDMGYVDSDGFLFLTDRKAFMIISGGVNIYPQEVEDCLALHPRVFDVAVIGVPDNEMGESVMAVVQPAPGLVGGPDLADELRLFLRDRMAHYKVPRTFEFVDELPRTPTGKLIKRKVRERYVTPAAGLPAPSPDQTAGLQLRQ